MEPQQTWTNESLNRLYADFNKRYFGGQLSEVEVLLGDLNHAAWGGEGALGLYDVERKRILIAVQFLADDFEVMTVLLHEMAHVAEGEGHGAAWKREVERLWQAGAPLHRDGWSTQRGRLKDDPMNWDETDPRWFALHPDEFMNGEWFGLRPSEVPEMQAGEMLVDLDYVPHILPAEEVTMAV